ncbi:MAG: hypothetical protein WCV90_00040 [Candidatus Woesearchaeota archaeon]|jgi:hypothetical protein
MAPGVLERCKRGLAKSLTLAALVGGAFFMHPPRAEAYSTQTIHPALVEKLAQFYQPQQLTFDLQAVKTGSINEDSPDQAYARAFHHFMHWQTGEGLPGFFSSYVWATRPDIQAAFPFGDHTWQRAVDDVKNNSVIGENAGYVEHLISDGTVPAHDRADTHILVDSYEAWTDEHMSQIMDKVQPQSIPQVNDLQQLMTELSQFTGAHFYSDDSIDGTVQTTTVQEGRRTYQMGNVEGKQVHVLREGFFFDYLDVTCLSDQWGVLGTKAVEYGAAAIKLLEKEAPICNPDCYNKQCGSDGCGSSCGTCASDQYCSDNTCIDQTVCNNECYLGEKGCELNGWKECQEYQGCLEWGITTFCQTDYVCQNGDCVYDPDCEPNCYGKGCGSDNCGGSCGSCDLGDKCISGICTDCSVYCIGKQCGPNEGCGGSCGSCGTDQQCNTSGQCSDQCVDLCPYEGYSDPGCAGTGLHLCGYLDGDSCLEWMIESCPTNYQCKDGACEYDPICQPSCYGKDCGDDGCGGSCGSCSGGESCQDGSCINDCVTHAGNICEQEGKKGYGVFWIDSCGNKEGYSQTSCSVLSKCFNGRCIDTPCAQAPQFNEIYSSTCNGNSVNYSVTCDASDGPVTFTGTFNCLPTESCQDGICKIK